MRITLSTTHILAISLIISTFAFQNTKIESINNELKAPVFISPVDNSSCETSCTFSWTSSGTFVFYEIWIADNLNFKNCEKFVTHGTSYNYEPQTTSGTKKHIKVRAWKNYKSFSAWSNIVSVTFSYPEIQIIKSGGCNGNCANCPHPCGRRSHY